MRNLMTLALAGLFGGFLLVGDASACHKKKCACPAPAPVCAPAPVVYCPPPAPVCPPVKKTCHFKMPKMSIGHHKKAACAPIYTTYAAPAYAPMASGQASPQGM